MEETMETTATSLVEVPASPISENTELSGGLEDSSDPPESGEGSDEFEDSDCGEPLVGQRLVLDFTPTEEDTDYIQRKCCAFWDFVNKYPELEGLAAPSDSEMCEEMSKSGDSDYGPQSTADLKTVEKTAVSMLQLVEEKGLIDGALASRLRTSHVQCAVPLDNTDDVHDKSKDAAKAKGDHNMNSKSSIPRRQKSKCQTTNKQRGSGPPHAASSASVRAMCQELHEWDEEHPKCMEPPGPAPNLESDVTQPPAVKLAKKCTCTSICRIRKHSH